MVLFDEDPVTLIRQTTRNFHTDSDLQAISRITSSLSTLRSARSLRLNAQQTQLSQLSRRAHHLRTTHDAEISRHDPAAHASDILALDTEKFRVAKAANELEIEGERLGSEVYGLKKQLQKLEEQGDEVESAENKAEDEVVLKLGVYRSLGIDAEQDHNTGDFTRAVIRNTAKGNVNVVNLDSKFDRFFYANHFWNSM
ncbi:kinetochore protein-like protein spc24 [Aureobasidium pullulans]|uniref:Kinetochore protein Spc24 n=1 Tax=Aureobasidium pullulans TaxID=5580 RepID=A0A4S9AHC5_AURPU|nr:kinetochore protein-like protein spc24 [Aureobasidium pullulans]THV86706.1 kinetochore protein-like protein spc24 [Aureobasidium pullulans]THW11343.1 kinetochore protein-like protein spc24 [Aureobasidium pullulans]THW34956.1 kinetochore protein-like protein spc24 [Aureobasidium pullulans]THW54919.1 kinetochore protein-like protein spc24 [Aureobasidium pullulans]